MSPKKTQTPPPDLHELEAEVMQEVWRRDGEVTVRDVLGALNGRNRKQRAYTTLMTILARLHVKGLLRRELRGKTHFYRAALTRDEYADARARAEVEALVAAYGDAALVHFSRQVDALDAADLRRLRRLAGEGT